MSLAGFKRIFVMGFRNFWRNGWLSLAAVFVMVITLFILSLFIILNIGVDETVEAVTEKIDLSIQLDEGITKDKAQELITDIEKEEGIDSVYFKSKEEAWEEFKGSSEKNKEITSELTDEDNPLWASLEVKVGDANKVQNVVDVAEQDKYDKVVDKVNYREKQAIFDNLITFTNFIKKAGLLLTIVFVTISFLIIFNTIRITIFSRREEVEIMKLVGATNWYVRAPFLFEGVLYGVIGAMISFAIIVSAFYAFYAVISHWTVISDSEKLMYFQRNLPLVLLTEMVVGSVIGIVSSYIAIRKHLKRV